MRQESMRQAWTRHRLRRSVESENPCRYRAGALMSRPPFRGRTAFPPSCSTKIASAMAPKEIEMRAKYDRLSAVRLIPVMAIGLLLPAMAHGQAMIKVTDDINLRFGALIQAWADSSQDATTKGYAENLYLRRIRILIGGQIGPTVSFFFETDNPNLGKAPKNLNGGFVTQDAFIEWKPVNAFIIDAGLMLPPLSRNSVESAATLLSLDY